MRLPYLFSRVFIVFSTFEVSYFFLFLSPNSSLDCDVHQENGTAALTAHDPTIYTFSIHGQTNFPFHKETSDLDIGLSDGTGDAEYLTALRKGIDIALTASQADLAIYLAGQTLFMGIDSDG